MGSGCLKVTKYFLFLFNLLFLVSIGGICRVEGKAWTKNSWKGVFSECWPSAFIKMARVLEEGRGFLKLRGIKLLCSSQVCQAAPLSVHTWCPQCTQLPSCSRNGKQELRVLSGRRVSSCSFLVCHMWSSSWATLEYQSYKTSQVMAVLS